jgi:Na+-transporting NADH:ubiquinone oxidoreductase subunit B
VAARQGEFASMGDLFLGHIAGSAGETSSLAILLGGLFLLATRVSNWRTVAGTLGSFLALGTLLRVAAPASFGPAGWHLFAGGLLFGAFFMVTDPVTSPMTNPGKWAYGILVGSLTVLIRNLTGYVEGIMFAILVGNIAAPLFDEIIFRIRFRRMANEG